MAAKRVLISIEERLLDRVDQACARMGVTRSRFLAQLADQHLSGGRGPGAEPGVQAALARIDRLAGRSAR
jgi:metal-responsive CopG/Arc/MetJ family transcriptional regulator